MKNLIYFLLILAAGYWIYSKCSGDNSQNDGVLKRVKVSVKTANLRTGPGTSYDFATANGDASGDKLQMKQGTVLQVVAVKNGWYQVRIPGDSTTAYIKQTLCTDIGAKGKKGEKGRKSLGSKGTSGEKSTRKPSSAKSPAASNATSADGVVEEVNGSSSNDEVLF